MKPIELIYVPYDSGRAGERFGRGPLLARDSGVAARVRGHAPVTERVVTHGGYFPTEGRVAFDLAARIARLVAEGGANGAFPLVVAGNCLSSLGTVSGMGGTRKGVVWLDAHADFNTPETSTSGFLDGMGAAVLVGEAWRAAAASVPGFAPIGRGDLLFLGARDIDPGEQSRLDAPPVALFSGDDCRADTDAVLAALTALGERCDAVYLHFDMDVTEPHPVPANEFAAPGGLDDVEVAALLEAIADRTAVAAAAVTAYDPGLDAGGVMLARYLDVIERIALLGAGGIPVGSR